MIKYDKIQTHLPVDEHFIIPHFDVRLFDIFHILHIFFKCFRFLLAVFHIGDFDFRGAVRFAVIQIIEPDEIICR